MTIDEVQQYFGSGYRVCKLLGLHTQQYYFWKKQGYIPMKHQERLSLLSEGKLSAQYKHGAPTNHEQI